MESLFIYLEQKTVFYDMLLYNYFYNEYGFNFASVNHKYKEHGGLNNGR